MIGRLFDRRARVDADEIYRSLVARARSPAFYADAGVADDVEGRLELLMLHVGLLVHLMSRNRGEGRALASALVNRLFAEVELVLREQSFGDKSLAKRLAGFGEAFYGRLSASMPALDAGDEAAFAASLRRNLFSGGDGDAGAVTAHFIHMHRVLAGVAPREIAATLASLSPFAPAAGRSPAPGQES